MVFSFLAITRLHSWEFFREEYEVPTPEGAQNCSGTFSCILRTRKKLTFLFRCVRGVWSIWEHLGAFRCIWEQLRSCVQDHSVQDQSVQDQPVQHQSVQDQSVQDQSVQDQSVQFPTGLDTIAFGCIQVCSGQFYSGPQTLFFLLPNVQLRLS